MKLTVIIKALNEDQKVEACIKSILRETSSYEAEVILVDSCSVDQTVEIAKRYPIKIVQFANKSDANCGAAVQLGYQVAQGDYVYLIDGDMQLVEGFLDQAFQYLDDNKGVAGVSGLIKDLDLTSLVDKRREEIYGKIAEPIDVKSLGGGGLYRKAAIDSVGYFGHQSLEANEELELGVRLITSGWRLIRLPVVSVLHKGHCLGDVALVIRYAKAGRLKSTGKAIKSTIGKKWFLPFIKEFKFIVIAAVVFSVALVFVLVLGSLAGVVSWFFMSFVIFGMLSIKQKSISKALFSLAIWNFSFFSCVVGFLEPLKNPIKAIESKEIKS
ncbi:glycosyltransferase family 2 protein [Cycloclasticus pugetii]|uniref:glycosyltransferase family 2 protein n=1 Tax=Cycloclasticus pugetii TaxID=34068 RepID=UPI003A95BD83